MKILKTISLILITLAVTSCGRNNEDAEVIAPSEKTSYNFVYSNSYKVSEIVLYKGPLGMKENPKEEFIKKNWDSYSTPEYQQIDVDIKNKTIHFNLGKNIIEYSIDLANDSIYISGTKNFVGILNKKNRQFDFFKSFYYIKKNLGESGSSFSRFTKMGITKYQDVFGINTFQNSSEMKSANDEVFWANMSYTFTAK